MAKRITDSKLGASVSSAIKSISANEQVFLLLISGALGAFCGFLSFVFEWMTGVFNTLFFEKTAEQFGSFPVLYAFAIIPFIPAFGGLLVGLLTWWTKMGHETASAAEVMKWTAVDGGVVRKRIVWFRMLATSIFLGSGGSGGREGPITQICGAMGSAIGQFMKTSSERLRLLVGCGAAAGIAATFNAPLAGVIFTVELILGDFNVISFLPIVISSVMATTVKRLLLGDIPAFETPPYTLVSPWEIGLYCILGIICGLVARLFFVCYFWAEEYFKDKVKVHPVLKPAIGGFVVGLIGIFLPGVFGNGYEVMGNMLDGEMLIGMAVALLLFKIIATSVALGSGGSGGIFAPALFIGCMTGGVFGFVVNYLAPGAVASPGAYAMVGLGAVMAAVAHAPLTNILMAYELTGNYQIILPIMTACILSTYVMTRLTDESLYTEKLRRRGIRLWRGRDLTVMDKITVREVMSSDVTTVPENLPFGQLMTLITTSRDSYFPVVDSGGRLTGIISIQNIRAFMLDSEDLCDLVVAKEIATEDVITVNPDNNLNAAMEKFAMKDIEQLPVVEKKNKTTILGMLSRTDVLAAYKKDVLRKPIVDGEAG
ncbi:Chloride channel protein [hydrothermal vent metagenome]|uniref:Chloride channel protein n=1 Tax=hydrothermal vent metagenome TaxID=652676 RepID=A0A3B1C3U6_9ZZZZ